MTNKQISPYLHNPTGVYYSCDRCDYKAKRKFNLKQHVESMHEGIYYSCELCDYKAKRKFNLKQHMRVQHGNVHGTKNDFYHKAVNVVQ